MDEVPNENDDIPQDGDLILDAGFSIDYDSYRKLTKDEKWNFNVAILDIVAAQMKALILDEA